MRKFGAFLFVLLLAIGAQGQEEEEMEKKTVFSFMTKNNILSHLDIGAGVSTVGLNVDLALPITDYVRIRAGYTYMPRITFHSNFPVETTGGGKASTFIGKLNSISERLSSIGININSSSFEVENELIQAYENGEFESKDYVAMGIKPNLHQFKFLLDIMPFKHNKHWSFTTGFFVGSSNVGEAFNLEEETNLLKAVNLYNDRYYREYVLNNFTFSYVDGNETLKTQGIPFLTDFVKNNGLAGFPLGYFADGERAMMIPSEDNTAHAELEVSKVRPYVGIGYNTHLSRNKKWNLNVDAGVLFICGKPKVYVDNVYKFDNSSLKYHLDEYGFCQYESGIGLYRYKDEEYPDEYYGDIVRYFYDENHEPNDWYDDRPGVQKLDNVDLMHDLHDMPAGKVRDMVDLIRKFKVYPHLSVTVSYRLY